MKKEPCFQFKANFLPCAVLQILSDDWTHFDQQLTDAVRKAPSFFLNLPVVIDLDKISAVEQINFLHLKELLVAHQMVPLGVRGGSDAQHQLAEANSLSLLPGGKLSNFDKKQDKKEELILLTKLVTTPVRSGMQIYARDGDLIVTASVSAGAEVLADGNVHIYGPLRGRVLAGVTGNLQARIFCDALEAELVSIAGYYLTKDDCQKQALSPGMKQIYLENEHVRIEMIQPQRVPAEMV